MKILLVHNTDVFRATVNFEEFFGGLKDANDFLEAVNSQQNSCFLDAKISTFSCYRSFWTLAWKIISLFCYWFCLVGGFQNFLTSFIPQSTHIFDSIFKVVLVVKKTKHVFPISFLQNWTSIFVLHLMIQNSTSLMGSSPNVFVPLSLHC